MFTFEARREQLEEFARGGEKNVLPALQRFDGHEGLLVLANRQNGKILIVTFWESKEAMRGCKEASYWFRAFSAKAPSGEVTNVERCEVVFSESEGSTALSGVQDLRALGEDSDDCNRGWYRDTATSRPIG